MKCNCKCNCKFCGYGAIIWMVAFIVACFFIGFKINSEIIVPIVTTLAVIVTAYLLARSMNISSRKEMLKYSFCWVILGLILDAIVTARFTGWQFFTSWQILLSYVLLFFVPLLAVKLQKKEPEVPQSQA